MNDVTAWTIVVAVGSQSHLLQCFRGAKKGPQVDSIKRRARHGAGHDRHTWIQADRRATRGVGRHLTITNAAMMTKIPQMGIGHEACFVRFHTWRMREVSCRRRYLGAGTTTINPPSRVRACNSTGRRGKRSRQVKFHFELRRIDPGSRNQDVGWNSAEISTSGLKSWHRIHQVTSFEASGKLRHDLVPECIQFLGSVRFV